MAKTATKTAFVSPYKQITDRILADLERGVAPWARPWTVDANGNKVPVISGFPMNFATGKQYRGINVWLLMGASQQNNWTRNAFATFKQISDMGGSVKKGSKSERVFFMSKVEKDPTGKDGEIVNENGKVEFWLLKGYNVFNIDQVENVEIEAGALDAASDLPEDAAELIDALGVDLRQGGDQAFFSPVLDFVAMPNVAKFSTINDYRATLYHEIGHWTGHSSRLDRLSKSARFGNAEYAFEELVAELSASFLCMEYGIEAKLQHSEYIASWIKLLKDQETAFYRAASDAQRALDFIRERAATSISLMRAA